VLYKGVFITAVDDYRVEGFKGIGMPDGNVVNTYTEATNGWRAQYGRIGASAPSWACTTATAPFRLTPARPCAATSCGQTPAAR
jgi:hypothetical protein